MRPIQTLRALAASMREPPPRDVRELHAHFSSTYFAIRSGMALMALMLPPLLVFGGKWAYGVDAQASISAYYWAATDDLCAQFPLRTVFVGLLVAIAAFLYAYKGLTRLENWLLNGAAFFAFIVAFMPEGLETREGLIPAQTAALYQACPAIQSWAKAQPDWWIVSPHWIAAMLMFACLFFVAHQCACQSLEYLPVDSKWTAKTFKAIYRGVAYCMVLGALVFGALIYIRRGEDHHHVLHLEWLEIWTFSAYWWFKTYELSLSRLERDPPQAVVNATARDKLDDGVDIDSQPSPSR